MQTYKWDFSQYYEGLNCLTFLCTKVALTSPRLVNRNSY